MHHPALQVLYLLIVVALQLAGSGGLARNRTSLAPADALSATVDHPLVPLSTVSSKTFAGEELHDKTGTRIATKVEETVHTRQKRVAGIDVTVVAVDDFHDGELHDTTADYFAQGADGTVYYLGERVEEHMQGTRSRHDGGSWLSGDQGTQPGVFMPADPAVGETFVLEQLSDVAIEQSTVIAVDQGITTAGGEFDGCLVTKEVSFPDHATERKTYCPGVGLVREDFLGGYLELVAFELTSSADGTSAVCSDPLDLSCRQLLRADRREVASTVSKAVTIT
jgi:hypothetical protein